MRPKQKKSFYIVLIEDIKENNLFFQSRKNAIPECTIIHTTYITGSRKQIFCVVHTTDYIKFLQNSYIDQLLIVQCLIFIIFVVFHEFLLQILSLRISQHLNIVIPMLIVNILLPVLSFANMYQKHLDMLRLLLYQLWLLLSSSWTYLNMSLVLIQFKKNVNLFDVNALYFIEKIV